MTAHDFDHIGKHVYENLEPINRYLGKAKFVSKLHSNDADTNPLGVLLTLTKEEEARPIGGVNELDLFERPSEEEIDALFDTIRSQSTTANKGPQRQGSFRKNAGIPLQQSRLINETNLMVNATMMTSSCSDLTGIVNKTAIQPKQPPVDVEALVHRFQETIDSLAKIENRKIESVDLIQSRQRFRHDWTRIGKTCGKVESLLDDCKKQLESNDKCATNQESLISNDLIKTLKKLQSKLHCTVYIKKSENLPDLTKTLSKEVFPLSECLDSINETIREKQL